MVAPTPSKLDMRQIFQNVHDEASGTLRTSAQAVIANADIAVQLDAATGDSVAIKSSDGTKELAINADGSINTTVNTNLVATIPVISNLTLTTQGTEYSVQLPTDTKKFTVKAVQNTAIITMSFVSLGPIITIPKGCSYEIDGVLLPSTNRTLYFIGNNNGINLEIVSWV